MSDLSQIKNNFLALITGKVDFKGMVAADADVVQHRISTAPAVVQPFLDSVYSDFKAGASKVVGLADTALGALVAQSTDQQATMLLNLMQAAGIPTAGPLSIAERAALATVINALKAEYDRLHLMYSTQAPEQAASAPEQAASAPAKRAT